MVQEIKVMRTSVTAREKERAERATLVQQEKLSKAKVPFFLPFTLLVLGIQAATDHFLTRTIFDPKP